jgi:hypothetical protein
MHRGVQPRLHVTNRFSSPVNNKGNGLHDTITMPATISSANYTIDPLSNGAVVFTPGKGPNFTVLNVEEVLFPDKTMFIENADNANIARLYSAAFDRVPDDQGLAFWEDVYAKNVPSSAKAAGYLHRRTMALEPPSPTALCSRASSSRGMAR